ncbi:MAG: S9 family peptidase, partial [Planctomycetota bacterium]
LKTKESRALLTDWSSIGDVHFAKSPFGERIFFSGASGEIEDQSPQAWSLNPVDGGVVQLSDLEDGLANLKVSPTGTHLAFTIDVKLDDEVTDTYEDLPEADARIIDGLMYRHWNAWHDYKYSHLCVAAINDAGKMDEPIDLMEGLKVDCPVPPFGGSEQFNWAPDGKQIAYTMKDVADWAESTNSDVYLTDLDEPGTRVNISKGMEGYDNDPVYSPDGKLLAFHSMQRPGFEADRNRIMIYDLATKGINDATAGLDQTAHGGTWLPDSSGLLFVSETQGTNQVFKTTFANKKTVQVSQGQYNWGLVDVLPSGEQAIVTQTSMIRPAELAVLTLKDGVFQTLTDINGEIFAHLELPTVEERWVEATDGKKIHCWVIYPPEFDPAKKYPLLTYCQGGPQGQIGQWFSYRWNFHLMAAEGYVVLAPNRRGLPGFGREWNDQISKDWGGQAMQDILAATDDMVKEPYIDKKHVAAIGASFGGYTVYWMMGNADDRFCCMIAHCGVFNLESMYGGTEELFFVNWDMGGPYWQSDKIKKDYERFSPHEYVEAWKTPLMVIHGEKDFRVPVTQGMEAFTAAQVQGVESRFLYFPEEGHWVMSPQNGVLWHRLFFDWLDKYMGVKPEKNGE